MHSSEPTNVLLFASFIYFTGYTTTKRNALNEDDDEEDQSMSSLVAGPKVGVWKRSLNQIKPNFTDKYSMAI